MVANVRGLVDRIHQLDKGLRPLKGKQVFKKAIRANAREIVDVYFREHRELLLIGGLSNLQDIDAGMHNLLEVAQRNSTAATYRATLKDLDRCLRDAEKQALLAGSSPALAHLE